MSEEKSIKDEEEAIEAIKSNIPTSGDYMSRESLDMAVEALKEKIKKGGIKFSPYPAYDEMSKYYLQCGCGASETKEVKEDCYFYSEQMDMGARIDICSYYSLFGSCSNCACKDCKKYISNKEVSKIIRGIVDGR